MKEKLQEFFSNQYPYDQLSKSEADGLVAQSELVRFEKNEAIYQLGDRLKGLYIVLSGSVEITDALGDVISKLGRGNSFGERGLMADGFAVTQAQASEASALILIPAEYFSKLIKASKPVANFFDRQRSVKRKKNEVNDLANQPIRDLMNTPASTVSPDTKIQDAALKMSEARVSCLVVCEGDKLVGIFTLRDLAYKVIGVSSPPQTVKEIMVADPVMVAPDDLAIDAMLMMVSRKIGHLPVVEKGKLIGIVTKSNLILRSANTVLGAVLEIGRAQNIEEMMAGVERLPKLLAQMVGAGVDAPIVTRLLTDIADAVTRRLILLYEKENGKAPVGFVWAACGSQGRQEQTGVSDQDNCLIIADEATDDDMGWFKGLAKYVSDGLDAVGYFYCPGDMMATNPIWCQRVKTWREYFDGWIKKPTGEAQMLASVMFDLRAIHGDAALLEDMRGDVLERASENSIFLAFLISNSLGHQPPLSLFRGISTMREKEHKNKVDLKHNGVVPITDLARVFAIMGRVSAVNTRARLVEAIEAGALSKSGGEDLIAAYDFIADLRLRHQGEQIRAGKKPDNFMKPSLLSDLERSHLRDAFVVVKSMQSALANKSAP